MPWRGRHGPPRFNCVYTVDGKKYITLCISFNGAVEDPDKEHLKYLAAHPIGSRVDVYYEPGNPQNSVLETGFHWTFDDLLLIVVSLPFLLWPLTWFFQSKEKTESE